MNTNVFRINNAFFFQLYVIKDEDSKQVLKENREG